MKLKFIAKINFKKVLTYLNKRVIVITVIKVSKKIKKRGY